MTANEIRKLPMGTRIIVTEIGRDTRGHETRGISSDYALGVLDGKPVLWKLPYRDAYLPLRDYKNKIMEVDACSPRYTPSAEPPPHLWSIYFSASSRLRSDT